MSVATYTKTGTKATTPAKLNKEVFGLTIDNFTLLHQAYVSYLANKRINLAVTKTRGLIRGGGKKPWRQKGTGRARFGSSRNPIWRGGGIVFGPTGEENYTKRMPTRQKQLALRQCLSLAAQENKVNIIEELTSKDGKVQKLSTLLGKINLQGNALVVVSEKTNLLERATRNMPEINLKAVKYLTVFDIMNADTLLLTQSALKDVETWLGGKA